MVVYSRRERVKQAAAGAYLSWRYKYKPKAQAAYSKYSPRVKAAAKRAALMTRNKLGQFKKTSKKTRKRRCRTYY